MNPSDENRIGLVTTELGVGGAEKCVTRLALGLQARGHSVTVFSLVAAPEANRSQLVHQLTTAGIEIDFLDAGSKTDFLRVGRSLKNGILSRQINIVQSFLYHANVVSAWALKGTAVRRFASLRVTHESFVRRLIHRSSLQNAEKTVCVSEGVASFAKSDLRIALQKLAVISNGVDIPQTQSPADLSNFGIPASCQLTLAAGRLTQQKGFDWLLNEASDYLQALPTARLVIVGDGEDRNKIESLAETHPNSNRIHILPWQANFNDLLARADVFLLPSRWEGMPNALMEAMASGCPVVANNVEGVAELLGESADRQLARNGHEFSQKVADILQNAGADNLGSDNRRRMEKGFSYERMIERWETVLFG